MRSGLGGRDGLAALPSDVTASLQPDVLTYTAVVSACGKGWMAAEFWRFSVTCWRLCWFACVALQVSRAGQQYKLQPYVGLQPDVITFTAVIGACGQGGIARGPFSLVMLMQRCDS